MYQTFWLIEFLQYCFVGWLTSWLRCPTNESHRMLENCAEMSRMGNRIEGPKGLEHIHASTLHLHNSIGQSRTNDNIHNCTWLFLSTKLILSTKGTTYWTINVRTLVHLWYDGASLSYSTITCRAFFLLISSSGQSWLHDLDWWIQTQQMDSNCSHEKMAPNHWIMGNTNTTNQSLHLGCLRRSFPCNDLLELSDTSIAVAPFRPKGPNSNCKSER